MGNAKRLLFRDCVRYDKCSLFLEFDLVISFSRCFATFPFPVSTCVTASVIVVYVQKHIERPDADVVPSPSDILSPNGAL